MTVFGGDAWLGGYYELAIELGRRSDERLGSALAAIWAFPDIEGCYLRRDVESAEQLRVRPRLPGEEDSHLYGIATLFNGLKVPCCTVVVREPSGTDWLDFCLPLAGLSKAIPQIGGYPFDRDTGRQWREPLDTWLAEVGRQLWEHVPFRLAIIGFEVSGMTDAKQLEDGMPDERWVGFLRPSRDDLDYLPVNRWR